MRGKRVVYTCANCGVQWEDLKSKAKQCCSKPCSEAIRIARGRATQAQPEVKAARAQTRIEKFGSWNSKESLDKAKATRLAKNNGEFVSEETRAKLRANAKPRTSEERRASSQLIDREAATAKSRATRIAKYSGWAPADAKEKREARLTEKYGPEWQQVVHNLHKAAMVKKYGVAYALQIPGKAVEASQSYDRLARAAKAHKTMIARHGVANPMQSPGIAAKSVSTRRGRRPILDAVETLDWWEKEYVETKLTLDALADAHGVSTSHLGLVAKRLGVKISNPVATSGPERRLATAISEFAEVVTNTKSIITPQEIDIWLPDHNIGVEVNGLYWHSEDLGKPPNYHRDKMLAMEARGGRLVQFWDSEVNATPGLCASMVAAMTGQSKRIPARKTEITTITSSQAREFLTRNHLQGFKPATTHYGLVRGNELLVVMSCQASLWRRGFTEIVRFATAQGVVVVGGFSKLLARLSGPIVSYSDNRFSTGGVYAALGFECVSNGAPTPWYTKDALKLHHRLVIADKAHPELTQRESARKEGWLTVWDAGQRTWVKHLV